MIAGDRDDGQMFLQHVAPRLHKILGLCLRLLLRQEEDHRARVGPKMVALSGSSMAYAKILAQIGDRFARSLSGQIAAMPPLPCLPILEARPPFLQVYALLRQGESAELSQVKPKPA